jgi:hypothetical protein
MRFENEYKVYPDTSPPAEQLVMFGAKRKVQLKRKKKKFENQKSQSLGTSQVKGEGKEGKIG